jgi:hypothetical protein
MCQLLDERKEEEKVHMTLSRNACNSLNTTIDISKLMTSVALINLLIDPCFSLDCNTEIEFFFILFFPLSLSLSLPINGMVLCFRLIQLDLEYDDEKKSIEKKQVQRKNVSIETTMVVRVTWIHLDKYD